jgi:type IV secretion system protein VirD4
MAMSYEAVKDNPTYRVIETHDAAGKKGLSKEKTFNTKAFIANFSDRINSHFYEVKFVKSTPKFTGAALFLCFIIVTYVVTSKKKLITGKENGSSEWETTKAIAHLLSKNIKKNKLLGLLKEYLSKAKAAFFSRSISKGALPSLYNEYLTSAKKEKEQIEEKYGSSDIMLTQTEKICMYNNELNNNTIVIGGSGSRKTTGFVLPNILQCNKGNYSPSLVVTDPKGEILQKIGKYLVSCGYALKVLNLKEMDKSFCFNPFAYIKEGNEEENINKLIDSLFLSICQSNENKSKDPFWDNMAKLEVKSLFQATYAAFPKEERTLNTVMTLFRMLDIDEDHDNGNSDLDLFFQCFEFGFRVSDNIYADGRPVVEDEIVPYEEKPYILNNDGTIKFRGFGSNHPAVRNYKDFRGKCKGKTAQSVQATALEKLSPFDETKVQRIFSRDEMELDQIGEKKTALFIVLPPTNKTYNFIANMLYVQLFDELEYCATVIHDQMLPVPVRFILDEFYNTGRIPNFDNILSYARSFGIGISIILQSLEQLKEMYEKIWGSIIDNCSTFLFLGGIRSPDTLKYISELIGQGTFDKKSYSITKGSHGSSSVTYDKIGRSLLDPSEIQRLKKNKCLLFVSGYNAFLSKKFNYYKHPNFKFTYDAHKRNKFEYQPPNPVIPESPHGEEKKLTIAPYKEIVMEFGQAAVEDYLSYNMQCLDFDDDEQLSVSDGELQELAEYKELEDMEGEDKKKSDNILSAIIQFQTNEEAASELIKAENEEKGSIDFDDDELLTVNDGEPPDTDDDELTGLLNDTEALKDEMNEDMADLFQRWTSLTIHY